MKTNKLYINDNLPVLRGITSGTIDLIYLDPPFNTKKIWKGKRKASKASYSDIWTMGDIDKPDQEELKASLTKHHALIDAARLTNGEGMAAYLTFMALRLIEMHRVLKPTGSIYLHCDPTASHYLKALMDLIFGARNFRNEIVWCYTGPGNTKKYFPRKHDVIFYYAKNREDYAFAPDSVKIPYRKLETGKTSGIFKKPAVLDKRGKVPEDWWEEKRDGMTPVGRLKKERTGYATQKPLALLERIIKASSKRGDMVLDPFCGCATACLAAYNTGRKFIGIDKEKEVPNILLRDRGNQGKLAYQSCDVLIGQVPKRKDKENVRQRDNVLRADLYQEQGGKCAGCGREAPLDWLETDHIIPRSKGGENTRENYQLLCKTCNGIKGNRPMSYLRNVLKQQKLAGA